MPPETVMVRGLTMSVGHPWSRAAVHEARLADSGLEIASGALITSLVVVQMHGESGAGKSTIARGLGRHLSAVVLDKDLFKNPGHLLELPGSVCGPYAYEALFSVATDVLVQGWSVVIDSPAWWSEIEHRGRRIAEHHGARYVMVEVRCDDRAELARRLASRTALAWQPAEPRTDPLPVGAREPTCQRVVVDTRPGVEHAVAVAFEEIEQHFQRSSHAPS